MERCLAGDSTNGKIVSAAVIILVMELLCYESFYCHIVFVRSCCFMFAKAGELAGGYATGGSRHYQRDLEGD